MASEAIYNDLEKQLLRETQELMNRRLNMFSAVLEDAELAMLLVSVASSMTMGAQVFIAERVKDGKPPEELLDEIDAAIAQRIAQNRPKVLRTAAALRAGEKLEAAI